MSQNDLRSNLTKKICKQTTSEIERHEMEMCFIKSPYEEPHKNQLIHQFQAKVFQDSKKLKSVLSFSIIHLI